MSADKRKRRNKVGTAPKLERCECELPPPLELAKLAAVLHRNENYYFDQAIQKAAQLYRKAVQFHEKFAKATAKEKTVMLADWDTELAEIVADEYFPWRKVIPNPEHGHPATLNEFLRRVVKAKTPADCEKNLRDYFRSQCPPGHDDLDFAAQWLAKLKEDGLDDEQWYGLGSSYLSWRKDHVSEQNRKNRQGKRKKPFADEK